MYVVTKKKAPRKVKRNKTARLRAKLRRKNIRRKLRVGKGLK
jgi:hypothetical protein